MADLASLGGIGAGLMAFSDSYNKANQQNIVNQQNQKLADMASQKEQAGLLGQGMQVGDNNQVSYTPEAQQMRDQQMQENANQLQIKQERATPGSDASKISENMYRQRIDSLYGKGTADKQGFPAGKSAEYYDAMYGEVLPEQEKLKNAVDVQKTKGQYSLDNTGLKNQGNAGKIDLKDLKDDQKSLQNDPDYKPAANNIQEYGRLKKTLNDAIAGNPLAANQIPIMVAKFQSGLKRINPMEIQASGGSKALSDRFSQAMEQAKSGNLTPENSQFISKMIDSSNQGDQDALESVIQRHAAIRASNKGIDQDTAYQQLTGKPPKNKTQVLIAPSGPAAHPQDDAAVQWAKANPKDPRSAAILKANGVQ